MLTLDPVQENTLSNRNPILQDWPNENQSRFHYHPSYDFGETTNAQSINISIKDVIGLPTTSHFTSFRLVTSKSPGNYTPYTPFIVESSLDSEVGAMGETFPINDNGMNWEFTPQFVPYINLNITSSTTLWFGLSFRIEGKTDTGDWTFISGFYHTIYLVYTRVKIIPQNLVFNYGIGSNIYEEKTAVIHGDFWELPNIPDYFDVNVISGIGAVTSSNGFKKIVGRGLSEISFTVNAGINQLNQTTAFHLTVIKAQINGIYQNQQTVGFTVYISDFFVNDDDLHFEATYGQTEPLAQHINFFSNQPVNIVAPLFVNAYIEMIDINGVQTPVITVKPILFNYLQPGAYFGQIIISSLVNGVTQTVEVDVYYTLLGTVNIPFSFSSTNFTLENKAIELSSYRDDTFFNLSITAFIYNFYTNVSNTISIPLKVPLFQKQGKIYIGEIIDNLMKSFTNLTTNASQYKLAEIALSLNETTYSNEFVRDIPAGNFLFAAGIKPVNPKLFSINNFPTRIFANQTFYVNMLLPTGRYRYGIFKDNTEKSSSMKPFFTVSSNHVYTHEISFSEYEITKGDLLTFKVFDAADQVMLEKTFAVIPDGMYSNNIIFEDTFKCKSNLVFSGEFSIETELNRIVNKRIINNFEGLEHINTSDKATLTINTGWILKTDKVIIKELMKTKRAFLQYGDTMLELRPISDKMIDEDSKRELIDYTIKFTINKTAHAQAYTY